MNPTLFICTECENDYCTNAGTNRTCINCGGFKAKRKSVTNADRIRSMTNEELAEWIAKHMYCEECMFFDGETGTCNYKYRYGKGCNGAMLDWLDEEVKDEHP